MRNRPRTTSLLFVLSIAGAACATAPARTTAPRHDAAAYDETPGTTAQLAHEEKEQPLVRCDLAGHARTCREIAK